MKITITLSIEELENLIEKADGTLRKAKGTLKDVQNLVKGTGSESYKTVRYYDVDKQSFRSFRIENFITAY